FKAAIRPDTILASIMMVNNEIGVIQPVWEIADICKAKGIIFHCDAVQGGGRVDIDMNKLRADLLTITAHKMYGPKGIGALYVRRKPRVRLEAQIHGGGHERGFRSGTLATHQIVGFGEAARLAKAEMATDNERIRALRDKLWKNIQTMEEVYLNGDLQRRIPHNLNVSFNFVEGESLIMAVKDIAVSSGSACTSASLEPSYVLRALGRNDELAHSSIRIRVGADGRIEDARFKTYGCGSAIASSSLVTEWVKGKTLEQAASIRNTEIAQELSLPPVKIHCSILAEDAIKAAVADYQKKHGV